MSKNVGAFDASIRSTVFRAFLRLAASIARERHADDVVHNAFVRVLRHRESFREQIARV